MGNTSTQHNSPIMFNKLKDLAALVADEQSLVDKAKSTSGKMHDSTTHLSAFVVDAAPELKDPVGRINNSTANSQKALLDWAQSLQQEVDQLKTILEKQKLVDKLEKAHASALKTLGKAKLESDKQA